MLKEFMDEVYDKINSNQVLDGMEDLINGLRATRLSSSEKEWGNTVESKLLTHPLKTILHTDPFTYRSFYKPRGYPGDAVLLDMIYFHQSVELNDVPGIGKKIYEYTSNSPACKAVRCRREYLAQLLDEMAEKKHQPKVLSVACGHLREIELSDAAKNNAFGSYIAMDQDPRSIKILECDYEKYGVTALDSSVRDLIRGKVDRGSFDLIYASGLYDYLDNKIAQKLTSRLFNMLSENGVLLIANFLPAVKDIGYMESYMGWNLLFRDELEMVKLVGDIPRNNIERLELFTEQQENIIFLLIHKGK